MPILWFLFIFFPRISLKPYFSGILHDEASPTHDLLGLRTDNRMDYLNLIATKVASNESIFIEFDNDGLHILQC